MDGLGTRSIDVYLNGNARKSLPDRLTAMTRPFLIRMNISFLRLSRCICVIILPCICTRY